MYAQVSRLGYMVPQGFVMLKAARLSAGASVATDGTPQEVTVTMDSSPAYLRGGHIMARRDRARRSTAAMAADPITLVRQPSTKRPQRIPDLLLGISTCLGPSQVDC